MTTGHGPESGLTLVEVLVALGIVAMAIGLGLPMLQRGSSPLQASTAAREILAVLREARTAAITENRAVTVRVDIKAGTLGYGERLVALPTPSGNTPLSLVLYTTEDQRLGNSTDGTGTIRFFPGGGSTGGGVAVSDSRRRILITVDWLSGQIRMADAVTGSEVRGAVHAAR